MNSSYILSKVEFEEQDNPLPLGWGVVNVQQITHMLQIMGLKQGIA